jgi:hypothetical protein
MAPIAIPAIVDVQLAALKASFLPHTNGPNTTAAGDLFPRGNRVADLLRLLTGLIDTGTLHVTGIHVAADAANVVGAAVATNQATADIMADELKLDYNLHRQVTPAVHGAAGGNAVTAAGSNGTEGVLVTLCNDVRAMLILHMATIAGPVHYVADPNVVTLAACTNLATAIVLVNHLKAIYNAHVGCIDGASKYAVADLGAFTGVNSLVGAKVTFAGNVTGALLGVTAKVVSNTTGVLVLTPVLSTPPRTGDHYAIEFVSVDDDLAVLDGAKGSGSSQSNPYSYGPNMLNAMIKIIVQLGGVLPAYLTRTTDGVTKETTYDPAEAFGFGSPHAGGSSGGHGGGYMLSAALQLVRDTVAAYTAPA